MRVTQRMPRRKFATLFTVPALALALSACGSSNRDEDKLGTFLVAPGKYILYDCQQLNMMDANYRSRRDVLRKAMADADKSPAGGLVNLLGYRTEYGQIEGNLAEIRREAASKNCTLKSSASTPPPPCQPYRRQPSAGCASSRAELFPDLELVGPTPHCRGF